MSANPPSASTAKSNDDAPPYPNIKLARLFKKHKKDTSVRSLFPQFDANGGPADPSLSISYTLSPDILARLDGEPCPCFPDWEAQIVFYALPSSDKFPSRDRTVEVMSAKPLGESMFEVVPWTALCDLHDRDIVGKVRGFDCVRGLIMTCQSQANELVQQNISLREQAEQFGMKIKESWTWELIDNLRPHLGNPKWCTSLASTITSAFTPDFQRFAKQDVYLAGLEGFLSFDPHWVRALEGKPLASAAVAACKYLDLMLQIQGDLEAAVEDFEDRLGREEGKCRVWVGEGERGFIGALGAAAAAAAAASSVLEDELDSLFGDESISIEVG
ncbi:hypothetical protein BDV96DRAFT_603700 [Lophiotrema nucula]|uniref:Uncharacterized protein n=1 Tax=Lophiotrema nucula TaxID=690887 RepID=A0A6A5YUN9_9PLEO|nr:hypothetical protein BDV96DRAFT_603700 [Lophiotrema nucula]